MIVVSDTSPISNLVMVNHIYLVPEIFGRIIIPDEVFQELLANGKGHPVTQVVQSAAWIEVRAVKDVGAVRELEQNYKLDPGEAQAIILAAELQANQLLIDERLGRAEAKRRGLSLVGVLGVLASGGAPS